MDEMNPAQSAEVEAMSSSAGAPVGDELPQYDARTAWVTAQTLLATLERDAGTVTAAREHSERIKAEIDSQLAATQAAAMAIQQHTETGRVAAAELASLSTSTRDANTRSTELATQASAALESARTLADAASASASVIEALKTKVEEAAQVAKSRSEHIEDGRQYVDRKRAEVDVIANTAQQSASNAEAQHQAGRQAVEQINALLAATQTTKANVDGVAEAVASLRTTVESHSSTTKKLSQIAEITEQRIAQYEAALTQLREESEKQLKVIEGLLAGATNTGLAFAFDARGKKFKTPERVWQGVFVGSLLGLVGLAAWHAHTYQSLSEVPDWQQLARMLVTKLPFGLPLIWLAIHSGRQAALAKRMEEEYAFKATTSMSFEGFRRQMAEIGKDVGADTPLGKLCANTLQTIAAPPGKVYDGQRLDPTPGTAAGEAIGPLADALAKAVAAKIPTVKP